MEPSGHKRANSLPPNADFWQVGIFHRALSEYTNKSHNCKNSNICDVNFRTLFSLTNQTGERDRFYQMFFSEAGYEIIFRTNFSE